MLQAGVLSVVARLSIVTAVLVALLDLFSVGLCVEKNANVPPNALAIFCLMSLCQKPKVLSLMPTNYRPKSYYLLLLIVAVELSLWLLVNYILELQLQTELSNYLSCMQ